MQNESQERWQILCAQIAAQQNPQRFTHLIEELLEELRKKEARLNALSKLPFAS